MAKIGVFDSGVGGLSVAKAIEEALPEHTVLFRNDAKNVPYGTKSKEQLLQLVTPILDSMVNDGCDVIVIACNTVTTNLIAQLRERMSVPLVGMEPMIKPAANRTQTGVIAVCATPMTLKSQRYQELKQQYAKGITVLEPDCSDWSAMIEADKIDQEKIKSITNDAIAAQADVIVLGCTHYHWIEENIKSYASERATVLQPEEPVIAQLKSLLSNAD